MDQNMSNMGGGQGGVDYKCPCPHHKIVPCLIVLIGLLFLLGNMGVFTMRFVELSWPVLLILIGLQKCFSHKCKCCRRP